MSKPLQDRVAVVTGAGRGLGRSHARLLAARGASVVVNDTGADLRGEGKDESVASAVVEEIRSRGGTAVADFTDVRTQDGGAAVVERARREFDGVDIVVANAGIDVIRPFTETTWDDYDLLWQIHVMGAVSVSRAAWPTMVDQHRGRIVLTSSTVGLMGMDNHAAYAAAKGAVHGLMRVLAIEGAPYGITANSVAPVAYTRMVEPGVPDPEMREAMRTSMPAELVSPLVCWAASDECDVTGEVFSTWGGRVARVAIGSGKGLVDQNLSVEKIAADYATTTSMDDFYVPIGAHDEISVWAGRMSSG